MLLNLHPRKCCHGDVKNEAAIHSGLQSVLEMRDKTYEVSAEDGEGDICARLHQENMDKAKTVLFSESMGQNIWEKSHASGGVSDFVHS